MEKKKANSEILLKSLENILDHCENLEKSFSSEIHSAHPSFRKSARNLVHYLGLRHFDMRSIQENLAELGLSSLGRSEAHVKSTLIAVINQLKKILKLNTKEEADDNISFTTGRKALLTNTENLLGRRRDNRAVRIMVTLSTESANDYELVKRLIESGMDCARINCAHDNKEIWIKIIDNIQRAKKETGLNCKIAMDLAGIKIRTGPLLPGPKVIKIKAKRDLYGKLTGPAKVWLGSVFGKIPIQHDVKIPVNTHWIQNLQPGDKLHFVDLRGKKREFVIILCEKSGCLAELYKRSYIESGTALILKDKKRNIEPVKIDDLPAIELPIILKKDDLLILHKAEDLGTNAQYDDHSSIISPARISCRFPEVFKHIKINDPILFDDGKIRGKIISVSDEMALIKITNAKDTGSTLKGDKGINLPESKIEFEGMQSKDLEDLRFIARHADIVNLSFVNKPEDVSMLQEELKKLKAENLGIMLKIETQRGFKNLPSLLLTLMKTHTAGVMIARGDLAVECGWERLAEIQEEILWLCEAAHIPVVWATQVLETFAKKGLPSRAEITDAAMSQRAECVMLNKGPYIVEATQTLSDILARMETHQHKKTAVLRNLRVTDIFNINK